MDTERYHRLFIDEMREILEHLERSLAALEQAPTDEAPLRELYRLMHTTKGMAASVGHQRMARLCHALESVLESAVAGSLPVSPELMNVLFTSAAQIERLTAERADNEREPRDDAALEQLVHAAEALSGPDQRPHPGPTSPHVAGVPVVVPRSSTVRIDVKRVDALINLAGEVLIISSRVKTLSETLGVAALTEAAGQLERVSDALQEETLQARMLPIGLVFERFTRHVRELARASGKQVRVVTSGHEIELDRTIVDEIAEPLVHLLRNAISYGIESPETRAALGKPEVGTITLAAGREADRVVLEVRDDGKGIDPEELRATAIRKGFGAAEQLQTSTPPDLFKLLFLSGFSTAAAVTELSGRGVGLSIVKTRVEALRGAVEVSSVVNEGTRFLLRFPPTLAILEALLVGVGDETFALPMIELAEVIEVERRSVEDSDVLVVRGKAVPLIDLARALGVDNHRERPDRPLVLISSLLHGAPGFVVDRVIGQQHIVIKPVEWLLHRATGVSGATILGDGRVVLILDLHALVRDEAAHAAAGLRRRTA